MLITSDKLTSTHTITFITSTFPKPFVQGSTLIPFQITTLTRIIQFVTIALLDANARHARKYQLRKTDNGACQLRKTEYDIRDECEDVVHMGQD